MMDGLEIKTKATEVFQTIPEEALRGGQVKNARNSKNSLMDSLSDVQVKKLYRQTLDNVNHNPKSHENKRLYRLVGDEMRTRNLKI